MEFYMNQDRFFSYNDKCYLVALKMDPELLSKIPLELVPGVYLTDFPHYALENAASKESCTTENIYRCEWVCPGYGLKLHAAKYCIKIDKSIPDNSKDRYFWLMIGALYLARPLNICILGSFSYGKEDTGFVGENAAHYEHRSNIYLDTFFSHSHDESHLLTYTKDDFEQTKVYFLKMEKIFASRQAAPRPYFVLKSFLEATLWEKLIYSSTVFSKLFPLIDSFAGNPTHSHEKKISKRLSAFLKDVPSHIHGQNVPEGEIKERLVSIWRLHRGPELHGYLKEPPIPRANSPQSELYDTSELKDLFDLMEIARLSIIKMLLLDEISYSKYCEIPIPSRSGANQKALEKDEFKAENTAREKSSIDFFEKKSYQNPLAMCSFFDFHD